CTTRIGLRDMRLHGRPPRGSGREARCLMPARRRLRRTRQGFARAVGVREASFMREPSLPLYLLRTAHMGKALLTRLALLQVALLNVALRKAGACPPFGDRRACLGLAEARGPIGRNLRREALMRLPVTAPIGPA